MCISNSNSLHTYIFINEHWHGSMFISSVQGVAQGRKFLAPSINCPGNEWTGLYGCCCPLMCKQMVVCMHGCAGVCIGLLTNTFVLLKRNGAALEHIQITQKRVGGAVDHPDFAEERIGAA